MKAAIHRNFGKALRCARFLLHLLRMRSWSSAKWVDAYEQAPGVEGAP